MDIAKNIRAAKLRLFESYSSLKRVRFRVDNDIDPERIRFGFFGEFGYGLIGWQPYLNFLADQNIPIKSMGLTGSTPFWNFSQDHIEVDLPQGDGWGEPKISLNAMKYLSKKEILVVPDSFSYRLINVSGHQWVSNSLHKSISNQNYLPLNLRNEKKLDLCGECYAVVNVKNYFNWGLTDIPNFYLDHEYEKIYEFCSAQGMLLVLNRFPSASENSSTYFEESYIDTLAGRDNVVDMAEHYSKVDTQASRNLMQISLLQNAKHVFATQGGNAVLTLICSPDITILMRGGHDYPDYVSLSRLYGRKCEIIYEIDQSTTLHQ